MLAIATWAIKSPVAFQSAVTFQIRSSAVFLSQPTLAIFLTKFCVVYPSQPTLAVFRVLFSGVFPSQPTLAANLTQFCAVFPSHIVLATFLIQFCAVYLAHFTLPFFQAAVIFRMQAIFVILPPTSLVFFTLGFLPTVWPLIQQKLK